MTEFLILHKIWLSFRFSCGRPVCFRGTYLFNTRMHFADIWFCSHGFWKYNTTCFWKISSKVSLYARMILILSKYLSELIAVWMRPQSLCAAHHESNIWGQLSANYGEGDTGHEQHEQMNCMSFMSPSRRSLQLSPLPLTFPCTAPSSRVRTILAPDIFATFWQELLPPWLGGDICVFSGACDVCQGLA